MERNFKKVYWLGISGFLMGCDGFAVVFTSPIEPLHQCALYLLIMSLIAYANLIKHPSFEGLFNEVSRND
ncbi:hypothetical protein I7105_003977 [Vibrio parahaemolyticus]|nr:hypothetical protein [Vibrio parahaemolyticus]TNX95954.1 hypothetical protein FHP20_15995 [Vibrio parahaemolyticus]TOH02879.1 hypothetical protein CGI89_15265 [Vibrio parahaemolyticus]TOH36370.1 hypothetical protein CGI82_19935 [Vibrio parahaemolyticus]TOK38381.1 hypothetical protein CGI19_04625 [Vibrio parahaemolyticus]